MTTKNTYGLKVVVCFSTLIVALVMGSFVVSTKYIDLGYLLSFAIFCYKYFRLEG